MAYEPPLSYARLVERYGQEKADQMKADPAQLYRMESGIELVYPEKTRTDQLKIWSNWLQMNNNQKDDSEKKSRELFGMTNKDHHYKLMKEKWNEVMTFREQFIQLVNKDGEMCADDFLRFAKVVTIDHPDGSFETKENENNFKTPILIKAGEIPNVTKDVQTTIGRVLVNRMLKVEPFGSFYEFEDGPVFMSKFLDRATKDMVTGLVEEKQIIKLIDNIIWLGRFTDMVIPSMSRNILTTPKKTFELREQLRSKYKKEIEEGDLSYVDKVEKPLVDSIKEELKDDPSLQLYTFGGSKPSIGNNLKQMILASSPIFDPSTGKYVIPNECLEEGFNPSSYAALANMNINGTYARAVGTRDGGAIVKSTYLSMNHLNCAEAGSDCGTKYYKRVTIDKFNSNLYEWSYAVIEGNFVLLTPEVIKMYIGKTLNIRSVLFCGYKERFKLCNKCVGELPYRLNLLSIGNLCARIGDSYLQSSLKQFHQSTKTLTTIDVTKYLMVV